MSYKLLSFAVFNKGERRNFENWSDMSNIPYTSRAILQHIKYVVATMLQCPFCTLKPPSVFLDIIKAKHQIFEVVEFMYNTKTKTRWHCYINLRHSNIENWDRFTTHIIMF